VINELIDQVDRVLKLPATKDSMRRDVYKFAILNGTFGVTIPEIVSHLGIPDDSAYDVVLGLTAEGMLDLKGNEFRGNAAVLVPVYAEVR